MTTRKKDLRRWSKGKRVLFARSDIGSIVVNGKTYHEAHLICYQDGSGQVTLRTRLDAPFSERLFSSTASFYKGFSVLGGLDESGMLQYIESIIASLKKGEIPTTHRQGVHFGGPEMMRFEESAVSGGVLV